MECSLKDLEAQFVDHLGKPGLVVFRCPNCRCFQTFRLKPYIGGYAWTGETVEDMTIQSGVVAGGHFRAEVRKGQISVERFFCTHV